MTWEGLYVALSRVEYRDHIRLAIKRNDRSTMHYISKLSKNKYTEWFFRGYGPVVIGGEERVWNRTEARKAAHFKTIASNAKRKKTQQKQKSSSDKANKRKRIN